MSFGDSFSDSGNTAHLTHNQYPSDPWFWHHRFSNGPNWIDHLIQDLGGLKSIHMRNFAHGGATSDNQYLQGQVLGVPIPGVHQQVRGFLYKSHLAKKFPQADSTLYMAWAGAMDCLELGGIEEGNRMKRNFTINDIYESIYQDIHQLVGESDSQVQNVLVLTPPPMEDSPKVRNSEKKSEVMRVTEQVARSLPYTLVEKFRAQGNTVHMTDSSRLAPHLSPHQPLPDHRQLAKNPISYYLSVDITSPHRLAVEHNGTHPRPLQLHKRTNRTLEIMVYDAYHFIKHMESHPNCYSLNPQRVNQTCPGPHGCYDRVWMDETNLNTVAHYWMARDLSTRLHLWNIHNKNIDIHRVFKNATKARQVQLGMLGYSCPMKSAPTSLLK